MKGECALESRGERRDTTGWSCTTSGRSAIVRRREESFDLEETLPGCGETIGEPYANILIDASREACNNVTSVYEYLTIVIHEALGIIPRELGLSLAKVVHVARYYRKPRDGQQVVVERSRARNTVPVYESSCMWHSERSRFSRGAENHCARVRVHREFRHVERSLKRGDAAVVPGTLRPYSG